MKRDLDAIANDMDNLGATIGIIENYISCIQLQASKAQTTNDRALIIWSLTEEKGLENIMNNLEIMNEKLNSLTNEIGDYAKKETR